MPRALRGSRTGGQGSGRGRKGKREGGKSQHSFIAIKI